MIDQELICKVNLLKEKHPCSTTRLDSTALHNAAVGGAPESLHLFGQAIDLVFDSISSMIPAALTARDLGILGIEVDLRNNHLHLDLRKIKWEVVYTKDAKFSLSDYLTRYQI